MFPSCMFKKCAGSDLARCGCFGPTPPWTPAFVEASVSQIAEQTKKRKRRLPFHVLALANKRRRPQLHTEDQGDGG